MSNTLGKSCGICYHGLDTDKYSDAEKLHAIQIVTNMETHNSVQKKTLINMLKWLLSHIDKYNPWIPAPETTEDDIKPPIGQYILLKFQNYPVPEAGEYREDKDGGNFYIGDDDDPCNTKYGLYVSHWMRFPELYEE